MQMVLDRPVVTLSTISEEEAHALVRRYVDSAIDPAFSVVADATFNHQVERRVEERQFWRFFVCCQDGPLHALHVDAQRSEVIPFSQAEIRVLREKAAIFAARKAGVLPLDDRGYVLGEYARRRVSRYLDDHISMYFSGADPVFVEGHSPVWQVTILFKRYALGPFTLGVIDVDAITGEPIPLSSQQIEQIRERTRAIIRHQTPATEAS